MDDESPDAMGKSVPPQETGHYRWKHIPKRSTVINSAGHVTCYMPAEILNSAHGGNDHYIHFFSADFYDFFAIFKAFFMTSFYGFGTWPKWPLQPLHFGIFGAAVTCYCRIDRNGTVHEMRSLFREVRDHKNDVILPYIDMCLIM